MQNLLAKQAVAMRRLLRRFNGGAEDGTGGNAAVEFALLLPTLVLMMVGTADFGMGFYRKMQVYDAAQAGAQWAMANGFDSTKISTAVTGATKSAPGFSVSATPATCQFCGCTASAGVTTAVCPGITIAGVTKTADTAPTCTLRCPDTTVAGTYVAVAAQATYTTMLSYPGIPASFAFAAQTTARIQ